MPDHADARMPRLATLLWLGAMAYLMIARPGHLAGDNGLSYRMFTTLASVTFAGYVAWRFHGIIPAAAALVLFHLADPDNPISTAFVERQFDAVFLGTLAIGVAAGSRQGRDGKLAWFIIVCVAAGLALFGWYGYKMPSPEDAIAHERMVHVVLAVALVSFVIGLLARNASWRHRLLLFVATLGVPSAGILALRYVHGESPRFLEGGDWPALVAEWRNAIANGAWSSGAWAWTMPWVVLVLLLIGLWRTIVRGVKERKHGRPPLAWLLAVAGLGAFAALGARPLASGSLALAATGALLSVFGVADLIQGLVERIELRPPDPGPSNIPRVK
jgi:hypothetical protein